MQPEDMIIVETLMYYFIFIVSLHNEIKQKKTSWKQKVHRHFRYNRHKKLKAV